MVTTTDDAPGPEAAPTPPAAPRRDEGLAELRRFHLVGPAEESPAAAVADLLPALLHPYRDPGRVRSDYPLYLGPGPGADEGLAGLPLADLLEELAPPADEARLLRDNLLRLERALRDQLHAETSAVSAREALRRAGAALAAELALPNPAPLEEALSALVAAVPETGRFLSLTAALPLVLLGEALGGRLRPAQQAFGDEVRGLTARLAAVLDVDRRKRPEERRRALPGLGELGARFVDPGALASRLGEHRGSALMPPDRRRRVEDALAVLETYTATQGRARITFVHDGSAALAVDAAVRQVAGARGVKVRKGHDPLAEAASRFDEEAAELARVLAAARLARLELAGGYDPERHDPWLERLDWESFSRPELALVPPVVAVVGAARLAAGGLAPLSRLLLSGRPLAVLVAVDPAEDPGAGGDAEGSFRFEPGYLGIGHREAFVAQTSAARPGHMLDGFQRAAAAARTTLCVVDPGVRDTPSLLGPALSAAAAVEGRAHPLFLYDPEAGASWARRLDFSANPAAEDDWPTAGNTDDGEGAGGAFTFADYALLSPAWSRHFRPLPEEACDEDAVPVEAWLGPAPEAAAGKIPYIAARDAEGRPVRLAVSRRLALAGRDRLAFWHTLQELAGIRNEHVEEAVRRAREEAAREAAAERDELLREHAAEIERVREEAAGEVAARLATLLLDEDLAAAAVLPPPGTIAAAPAAPVAEAAPAAPAPEKAPPEEVAPPAAEAPAEEELEAYIDTELCTSCNDCIQISPQLFAYNADKKAYIKDPRAGTFRQLVAAAEKCPARIIHPGSPLDPDEPDLADLVARAAPFNG